MKGIQNNELQLPHARQDIWLQSYLVPSLPYHFILEQLIVMYHQIKRLSTVGHFITPPCFARFSSV